MVAGYSFWNEYWLDAVTFRSGTAPGEFLEVAGEELVLLPNGAVFWPSKSALWLSDLHLGKAAHFRKNGVPIGSEPTLATIHRLRVCLQRLKPDKIWLLGDLFHSDINREWEPFAAVCQEFAEKEWVLVRGNHDGIPDALLRESSIRQLDRLDSPPFTFTHDPGDLRVDFGHHVCGHVHPGIRLEGSGRQRLRVRCFHLSERQIILPAFGDFTGMHVIHPAVCDRVFAVTGEAVIEV